MGDWVKTALWQLLILDAIPILAGIGIGCLLWHFVLSHIVWR